DFVAEEAGVHPADDQEVDEGHYGAIQDAVLRLSEPARPVADRHLDHAVATHPEERRNEPVKASIERQPAQALAPKGAEGTSAILDHLVGHPGANTVREPRRPPPDDAVAGPAGGPPPATRHPA